MKKFVNKTLGLLLSASFIFTAAVPVVGCSPDEVISALQANVSVIGGTGGGKYSAGENCTVTATVPENAKFVEWTVYDVPVSTNNPYTFKVDFDIEVKAVFQTVEKTKYTVTVNGGTIGDTGESVAQLEEGAKVSIHAAESQARKFIKWQIGEEESTSNPYELTVTGNREITAVFEDYCMVSVSGGTVAGGRSTIVKQGTPVTVTARDSEVGQRFVYWYILDENFREVKVSDDAEYTFNLDTSLKIYAKFKHTFAVEAVNGTIKGTNESSGYVLDGESVVVTADNPPSADKAFVGWYLDGVKVSIADEYTVSVTKNVHIEAKFGELKSMKIKTPDYSGNANHSTDGLIYRESGGAVAFDRLAADNSVTMFVDGAEYAVYKIYNSRTADKENAVGELRLAVNPTPSSDKSDTAKLTSEDGARSMNIRGSLGNLYFDSGYFSQFQDILRYTLGYKYCSGQSYYFAVQVKAPQKPYITMENDFAIAYDDSEISEIGSWGYCENPSAPVGEYTVKIENGYIDGTLTEIVAGHGAQITAVTQTPEDDTVEWLFSGWKEVTTDAEGNETLGSTLSRSLSYTFTASKNVTLRAVFVDKTTVTAQELLTPDNSGNKLFYEEGAAGTSAVAIDRGRGVVDYRDASNSMFSTLVSHAVFYMYESSDAAKEDFVAQFILYIDINKPADGGRAMVGYFTKIDGTEKCEIVRGSINNYYVDSSNRGQLAQFIVSVLGDKYDNSKSYYFAAQAISDSEDYLDSAISAISTKGVKF